MILFNVTNTLMRKRKTQTHIPQNKHIFTSFLLNKRLALSGTWLGLITGLTLDFRLELEVLTNPQVDFLGLWTAETGPEPPLELVDCLKLGGTT